MSVCRFCGHIGEPLLCGCVTELRDVATQLAFSVPMTSALWMKAQGILTKDAERVAALNAELNARTS